MLVIGFYIYMRYRAVDEEFEEDALGDLICSVYRGRDDMAKSRCVYELEQMGEVCKLTILHFEVPAGQEDVSVGWSRMAASMKSLIETGEPLILPPMG